MSRTDMRQASASAWCTPERLAVLRGWAESGISRDQVAKRLFISTKELSKWIQEKPEIQEALAHLPEEADFAVIRALHQKATGYTVTVKKAIKCKSVLYEGGKKVEEREEICPIAEEIYLPPDLRAQAVWLENRLPGAWKFSAQAAENGESGESTGGVVVLSAVALTESESDAEAGQD